MLADISNSPIHIQPEWYFLHLYAILRSIPNKVGGLLAFVLALLVIPLLIIVSNVQPIKQSIGYYGAAFVFLFINILLL